MNDNDRAAGAFSGGSLCMWTATKDDSMLERSRDGHEA